ncbi:Bug family tripartite tricarboxylate transporter substrate binding protein [Consotaella salsifontis]|uniref:Tripartite-type tricarboxylate transporter, receptor component TctC n=1 Tax=Consotaella salsifontis TaxID=1365950 RepID=A0A1T4MGZ2_9HYPH|nr:tripartite tricarboxylate transporter substrate binding protein [Consotaella salsifontis]SJZ66034.1 Tripartite-type tricarboxylate transporter, receptor component TctC [Consotaella salsifontis]
MRLMKSVVAVLLAGSASAGGSLAAEFPQRPVTIIVPAAAGGGGDTTTRLLARSLEGQLGQPITIINQGQGGGVVGLTSIKNATPDGYTVGLLFPYAGYRFTGQADFSASDFTPIANFNGDSSSIVVASGSPFKSLKEALDALKASPSEYKIHCSGGCGSVWDVPVAAMMLDYGIAVDKISWIPGQGAATGLTELASGGVDFQTVSLPEASSLMKAGVVRPLAVLSPKKVPGFEDVSLAGDTVGHPVDGGTWRAIGGPAGIPEDTAATWEAAIRAAVESDEFQQAMATANFGVKWMSAEELAALMHTHEEETQRVMTALGYQK